MVDQELYGLPYMTVVLEIIEKILVKEYFMRRCYGRSCNASH